MAKYTLAIKHDPEGPYVITVDGPDEDGIICIKGGTEAPVVGDLVFLGRGEAMILSDILRTAAVVGR